MKFSSLFRRWFLSYLVMVLITIVFSLGLYEIYGEKMEKEVSKLNHAYLSQMKVLIDGEIHALDKIINIIGLTPTIQPVIGMEEDISLQDRFALQEALKDLTLYDTSSDFSNGIYLYVFKPDLIITNASVYSKYMDIFTT